MKNKEQIIDWIRELKNFHPNVSDLNYLNSIEKYMKDDEFVRIKMEMPKRCWDCRFYDDNYDYPTCIVNSCSKGYNFNGREKRMDDCPLI